MITSWTYFKCGLQPISLQQGYFLTARSKSMCNPYLDCGPVLMGIFINTAILSIFLIVGGFGMAGIIPGMPGYLASAFVAAACVHLGLLVLFIVIPFFLPKSWTSRTWKASLIIGITIGLTLIVVGSILVATQTLNPVQAGAVIGSGIGSITGVVSHFWIIIYLSDSFANL
jgi:hypothetical protein